MLNVGVIGVGNMGKNHARVYSELENSNLVAISDVLEEAGNPLSKQFNCKYYKDYREMLDNEALDAVSVVVPTTLHREIALEVIKRKIPLLLEKPIADTIENAEDIIKAAKQNQTKLFIGHIERFNSAVRKLFQLIKEERLGNLTSLIATRVCPRPPQIKDANVILDLAIHDIDILNLLASSLPEKIYATGGKALINDREDYAQISLKYPSFSASVIVNWLTPIKIRKLLVTGTKAYAELDYINQTLVIYDSQNKNEIEIEKKEPLKEELKSFLSCIEEENKPECTGEDGLNALKVVIEAIKKIKEENI